MGWTLRVEKCHDYLTLEVAVYLGGNTSNYVSKLVKITWPQRGGRGGGNPSGEFTWSWNDPPNEERDLTPWVGDAKQIWMRARIIEGGETGDHQCDMVVRYNGRVIQRWEFDETENHVMSRPVRIPF